MENLKVIEWNVASVDLKRKDKVDAIINEIINQNADVVVLTEVTFAYRIIADKLLNNEKSNYFAIGTNNAGNPNNIVIAVSSDKIAKVIFDDLYAYKTGKNLEEERVCEQHNHPDRLLAHLILKNGPCVKLMGIRMQVSGLSNDDKCKQLEAFQWEIKNTAPDIIIGDFNWISAIQRVNKEDEFNNLYLCKKERGPLSSWENRYNLWPDGKTDLISYKKKKICTAPDRVMWKDSFQNVEHKYYNNLSREERFPSEWKSDHDILILDIEV